MKKPYCYYCEENMTEAEEIKRGEEARIVFTHPLFVEAIKGVRDGIVSSLETSALGDEKLHNRLTIALQLLSQIEKQLKTHMETGKMAVIQADDRLGQKLRLAAGF